MERRNLLAGLAVLALSLFVLSGTAFAHVAHHKRAKPREAGTTARPKPVSCTRCPAQFMDQGEFGAASSVADVIEVECEEVYAEKYVRISANELYSRCDGRLYWRTPYQQTRSERVGAVERPELLGAARQRRQRDRGRDRRPVLCGRRKPRSRRTWNRRPTRR